MQQKRPMCFDPLLSESDQMGDALSMGYCTLKIPLPLFEKSRVVIPVASFRFSSH